MDTHTLLIAVQTAIVVGIAGFVLADRLRLPAIVLLLLFGVLVGPEVLNLVDPKALGSGLSIIVSTAVAIIVFEGGMLLDIDEMRAASPPIRNLMTVGVFFSVAGGTLAAWLIAGLPFEIALLFGSLMCVTGPTVITPLLKRANVNIRLQTILQSEAVLVDAIGAVLAVVVLEVIIESSSAPLTETLQQVVIRLGVGSLVGVIGGYVLVRVLRQMVSQNSIIRLGALGGALGIYALAEVLVAESGIAAVALAGIIVGNLKIPHREAIHQFKGDLTNLGIAVLFILLAAGLRFETLAALGLGGVLAVIAMMVIVRPISVFASMMGTSVPMPDRWYIAALGPRGVVAASVATFAALQLQSHGFEGADRFVGLVFMTIIGTVVLQGLYAKPLAQRLGVNAMHVLIVSADLIANELAKRLISKGYSVSLLDTDAALINKARSMGLCAFEGDGTDQEALLRAGIKQATVFVSATSSDRTNLLACQIAMQRFAVPDVVARVNNPENLDNFKSLGIRVVSPVISAAMLLDNLVSSSAAMELLTGGSSGQEVFEAALQNPALIGKQLKSWALKNSPLIILARRDGQIFVPHGNSVMQKGDVLTLISENEHRGEVQRLIEGL